MLRRPKSCLATLAVLGMLLLAPGATQAQIKLPKLPLSKEAMNLLTLLDQFTEKESEPLVKALQGAFKNDGALVLANQRLDVSVCRQSSNWRGAVKVTMSMPAKVNYSVDLTQLKKVRWDPQRKIITVVMPPLHVHGIEALLAEKSCERTFPGWLRYRIADSSRAEQLEDAIFRQDYMPAARDQAERNASYAGSAARENLRQSLRNFLRVAVPDIEVIVE
jgi:hypothetical protein